MGAEDLILLLGASSAQPPESSRVAQCAALAVEEAPAGEAGKRGGACLRPRPCAQWTLCVHRCRCFLSPATHTEPPAGVLAGLQVAAMPTRNSCGSSASVARLLPNSMGGAPTSSAQQSPASHPLCPPPTRCCPRLKTPTAARHSQRNSSRQSAPS